MTIPAVRSLILGGVTDMPPTDVTERQAHDIAGYVVSEFGS